jgi:hypothetical protein
MLKKTINGLCLLGALAWASASFAGVPVDQATPAQREEAEKHFKAAAKDFEARKYEPALAEYRASFAVVESPNSQLMIARCLKELKRFDEAYREYEASIALSETAAQKDKKYTEAAKAARDELSAVRSQIALVSVTLKGAPSGSQITVNDRAVSQDDLQKPLVFAPGTVKISATTPAGERAEQVIEVAPGGEARVELDLTAATPAAPAPAPPVAYEPEATADDGSGLRTMAYIAGGVGAAGIITFTVFGILNNSTFSDLEESCPNNQCPDGREDDIDTGRNYQLFANIGLAVGVVGLGVGAGLYFLSSGQQETARAQKGITHVSVGPGYVGVRGRF